MAPLSCWRDTSASWSRAKCTDILADAGGNVRALLQPATTFEGEGTSGGIGLTLERYDYTPFGRPIAQPLSDLNGDGRVNDDDGNAISDATTAYGTSTSNYDPRADLDHDGDIDSDDYNLWKHTPRVGWVDLDGYTDGKDHLSYGDGFNTGVGMDLRIGYRGYIWDQKLGMYHVRNRVYDPVAQRFIQPDPIGDAGGDHNWYRYVQNHPWAEYDPSGLIDNDYQFDRFANAMHRLRTEHPDDPALRYVTRVSFGVTIGFAVLPAVPLIGAGVTAATGVSIFGEVTTGVIGGVLAAEGGGAAGHATYTLISGEIPYTNDTATPEQKIDAAADLTIFAIVTGASAVPSIKARLVVPEGTGVGPKPASISEAATPATAPKPVEPTCPAETTQGVQGVVEVNPRTLNYTQTTAGGNGRTQIATDAMSQGAWPGGVPFRSTPQPIDVVRTPNGLVTLDNTRPTLAIELGWETVPARIHAPNEPLPPEATGRFGPSRTWGEAAAYRASRQNPPLPPTGTPTPPRLQR